MNAIHLVIYMPVLDIAKKGDTIKYFIGALNKGVNLLFDSRVIVPLIAIREV